MSLLLDKEYDLIIIGGGINGTAIARDAAMRGLSVALFEKNDFACGASSKSSKLAHGGLRYLEHLEFGLVRESLIEKELLLRNAPHLVKPLPFLMPVYKENKWPLWIIKLGFHLYDFLSPADSPRHQNISLQQFHQLLPALNASGLKGGCLYYDAEMQDNRIVIENFLSAEAEGAIALNYTPVTGFMFDNNKIVGVYIHGDQAVRAKVVVNATGAWSNSVMSWTGERPSIQVYPTKGIHLIIPLVHHPHALILNAPQDGRVFFVIPWNGYSLLGTTDTIFEGDPNTVDVESKDVEYLIQAFNSYFPDARISSSDLLAAYAGLRPLVGSYISNPYCISRTHRIHLSKSGLITILGGKYTTHRRIAEDAVDIITRMIKYPYKKSRTSEIPLFGAVDKLWINVSMDRIWKIAQEYAISVESAKYLVNTYGSSTKKILDWVSKTPGEECQICTLHPHIYGEISYAIHIEKAKKLQDWFERRTSIAYTRCQGLNCLEKTAQKFAFELGWDAMRTKQEKQEYLSYAFTR